MAGMRHDWHVIVAAPRVELRKGSIELAADLRSQARIGRRQISRLVEAHVRQMPVVCRPKSHRRIELNPDKPARGFGRVANDDLMYLDGAAHDRHGVHICGTAPMMQVNDDYYEGLTEKKVGEILESLK